MLRFPTWKLFLIAVVCAVSFVLALPNVLSSEMRARLSFLPSNVIPLGLDLRGGSYVLLEIDLSTYLREQLEQIAADVRTSLRTQKVEGESITYTGLRVEEHQVIFQVMKPEFVDAAKKHVRSLAPESDITVNGTELRVAFSETRAKEMARNVMEQSLEIVRRRIDETGTREPDIVRQGDTRILVQVPGFDNPERLKQLLGKTAKLSFHLLDDALPYSQSASTPTSAQAVRIRGEELGRDGKPSYYAVKRQVILNGEMLTDARMTYNQTEPVVSFRFNDVGAKKFGDVTQQNVGKPFAIVLDNKVISAPVIREPILGGSGVISGHFTPESANDLAVLLRAGALPAPLTILEERSIGPSLGADSIAAGRNASLLAVALVMVFMVISYGLFGLFANIALLVNLVIIVAAMSLMQATLTLPGIAGVVLTMGMAVDANVLIYERMREEMGLGKTPIASIENGFRHAFHAIFDAHITTLIAAFMLFMFGSGTVKGFAVTLAIGLTASLFTAVMLSRWMVSVWVKRTRPSRLPL